MNGFSQGTNIIRNSNIGNVLFVINFLVHTNPKTIGKQRINTTSIQILLGLTGFLEK